MVVEVDFPRGGGITSQDGHLKKKHTKSFLESSRVDLKNFKANKQKKVEKLINTQFEEVFRQNLTYSMLSPGVRALGIVREIRNLSIILESANGVYVTLPANSISRIFTNALIKADKALEDAFEIGQVVAFKVIKQEKISNTKKYHIEVSTCPYEVNSHLVLMNLVEGLVLNGIVVSIEEKGVVVDFGLPGSHVNGFVANLELPSFVVNDSGCADPTRLFVGSVLLLRVKIRATTMTRVIAASGVPELQTLEAISHLNQLMPGTLLTAQPERFVDTGVYVLLPNGLKGFVHGVHMPPRYRLDKTIELKLLRVCVLACQQNSPLLVLCANNDVLAMTKLDRHLLPDEFKIGTRLKCKVLYTDKSGNVFFTLPESENGKLSNLLAKAPRGQIDDKDTDLAKFVVGSMHLCRVIAYSAVDRLVIVSTKKEVLDQKVITIADLRPGHKYTLTITGVTPAALTAKYGRIQCFIPATHVQNKITKIGWEKRYQPGQELICCFLNSDTTGKKAVFTAKPALVESKDYRITAFDEGIVGLVSVGTISKLLSNGGVIISFYNRVAGFLPSKYTQTLNGVYLGMPVKVRVVSLCAAENRILLDLGEGDLGNFVTFKNGVESRVEEESHTMNKKKEFVRPAKPFFIYTAKVVGAWSYGGTSSFTSAELLLDGGTVGRLHASELDLSNYKEGDKPMEKFLNRNISKTVNVKVICVASKKTLSKENLAKFMKKFQTSRFVDCTMNPNKMSDPIRKLNHINFQIKFHYGQIVPTFCIHMGGPKNAEINPLFQAIIRQPNVKDLENGTFILGKVTGVNKTTRTKCIHIGEAESTKIVGSSLKKGRGYNVINEEVNNDDNLNDDYNENKSNKILKRKAFEKEENDEKVSHFKRRKFMKFSDPGFDWSTAGFTFNELTNLRLNDSTLEDAKNQIVLTNESKKITNELSTVASNVDNLTNDDYSQLIAINPNSAEVWIRTVVHFITRKDANKAREILEKALKVIIFENQEDIYKIWIVYLNLELLFGTEEMLKSVFERACGATNSFRIHKHLATMYKKMSRNEEASEIFERMIKKFRYDNLDIWYLYGKHLLEINEPDKCHLLLERALQSLDKKHHIFLLCQFAKLEYEYGDAERGRTMFEKVLHAHSRKLYPWTLFADMTLKYSGIVEARKVFQRCIEALGVTTKVKMPLKKWMEIEKKFGDKQSQELVRERTMKLLDTVKGATEE